MLLFHSRGRHQKDRGIYLTLVAVFGVALLGLTALVIQLGFIAVAQSRLQLVTNLAALSAIEQYIRYIPPSDESAPEVARRGITATRADTILQANPVWGLDSSKFQVQQGETPGSRIVFGTWYRFDPDGPGGVTCEKYPCFVQSPNATTYGNAVRLIVQNESDNPFARFVGTIFGPETITIRAEATATLVKRCMAFLVDLSLTATSESHVIPGRTSYPLWRSPSAPPDPLRESAGFYGDQNNRVEVLDETKKGFPPFPGGPFPVPFPTKLGLYAYVNPPDICSYPLLTPAVGTINYSALYWCSLLKHRNFLTEPPLRGGYHTRADYHLVETPFTQNEIYLDFHTRPEPFSTYLLAFNAAIRSVYGESSNADEAMLAGFSKSIVYAGVNRRFPQLGNGLTRNLPLLAHLTNINNIGSVDPGGGGIVGAKPPTFIDLGIFPIFGPTDDATASNLVSVIKDTADVLAASCGPGDKKSIILATDGLGSCTQYPNNPANCGASFMKYISSEMQLLSTGTGGVSEKLTDKQVALTILHSGVGVRPNFRKITTVCPDGTNDCLLDYDGALRAGRTSGIVYESLGLGSYCENPFDPNSTSFINCAAKPPPSAMNQTPNECVTTGGVGNYLGGCEASAFLNLGQPGVYLGRVAAVMAELAKRSGGRYCPILDTLGPKSASNDNYYDHDRDENEVNDTTTLCEECTPRVLKASALRSENTVDYSLQLLTKGEQAADCATRAVGGNPFTLVEESR